MVSSQSSTQTPWQPTIAPKSTLTTNLGVQTSQRSILQQPCLSPTSESTTSATPTTEIAAHIAAPSRVGRMLKNVCELKELHSNKERVFPKPTYSYSCLVALALKNSATGSMHVTEIYNFICDFFPYFRTAPKIWKNAVRHCLSLNNCFQKTVSGKNRLNLWSLNKDNAKRMDNALKKWYEKDPEGVTNAMEYPEFLTLIQAGEVNIRYALSSSSEEEEEEEEGCSTIHTLSNPRLGTDKVTLMSTPTVSVNHNVCTLNILNQTIIMNQGFQSRLNSPFYSTEVIKKPQGLTVISPPPVILLPVKSSELDVLDDPAVICLD